MEYVRLGHSGLKVSRIALGCMSYGDPARGLHSWTLDEEASQPFFRQAVELGITFWDTANVYQAGSSEEFVGRAIKAYTRREEIVVATKVSGKMHDGPGGSGLSRAAIMEQVDASLRRLDTDYIDLYLIHRFDPDTPVAETMEALHDVVRSGKARYLGASSMTAWQFAKAQSVAPTPFVSMQNHYNLIYREEEREMIPQCLDQGVGLIPWSPLARGLLAGNRTREGEQLTERARTDSYGESLYTPEVDFGVIDRAGEVAAERGVATAQVALAWLLHKPGVTAPIVGTTRLEHLEHALGAAELELSADEIERLEEPYVPHAVSEH